MKNFKNNYRRNRYRSNGDRNFYRNGNEKINTDFSIDDEEELAQIKWFGEKQGWGEKGELPSNEQHDQNNQNEKYLKDVISSMIKNRKKEIRKLT